MRTSAALVLVGQAAFACDLQLVRLGPVRLQPYGFLESIAAIRSDSADGISTKLGRIPLEDTPTQVQNSLRHSRLALCGSTAMPGGSFSGYFESDFLDAGGRNRFRARQYFAEFQSGGWRVLGGQAWSLLRPGRSGIRSQSGLMNTLVIEPAYHTGLAGLRKRQVRITRDSGHWHAAASYEAGGDVVVKLAHDGNQFHWEAMALNGKLGRRAASVAAVIKPRRGLDIVAQQFWSKGAGPELLALLPARVKALATIEGVEWRVNRDWQLFAYAGLAYGSRSSGNRAVTQWTAGFIRHVYTHESIGSASIGAQYSQLDRAVWGGPSGRMNYAMISFRYMLPGSPSLFSGREHRASGAVDRQPEPSNVQPRNPGGR